MPQAKPNASPAASDFIHEMRAGLQAWLRKVLRDPAAAQSDDVQSFFESSDPGLAKDEVAAASAVTGADDNGDNGSETRSSTVDAGARGDSVPPSPSSSSSLSVSPPLPEANRESLVSLADFVLLKVIGKGSFGKVLLVRKVDSDSGQVFAMKVLKKENIIKRNQVEHTKTERNVLEYLRHPFVVSLRYAFQTATKLYFVLDYCAGGELFFHLGKMGKFSEPLAKFYAAEIVLALQYLHNLGIVYRDLKPENVLLQLDGHIALTDFGLSKEGIIDNTSAHSFCGTPEYLAPEILNRTGHGRAADWWSLGALLYEMLTGMPPFYSRDRERLFQKILKAELQFPRFISAEAKSLLKGLLNRDPIERLGSARDDAAEILAHPFFADIDFDALVNRRVPPPFVPATQGTAPGDTSNFDAEFTALPIRSVDSTEASHPSGSASSLASLGEGRFAGFTYVGSGSGLGLAGRLAPGALGGDGGDDASLSEASRRASQGAEEDYVAVRAAAAAAASASVVDRFFNLNINMSEFDQKHTP